MGLWACRSWPQPSPFSFDKGEAHWLRGIQPLDIRKPTPSEGRKSIGVFPWQSLNGAVYIFNSFTWSVQERGRIIGRGVEMTRSILVVAYVVVLIAIVVGTDLLFFRHRFWERLIVNIGIVLVFAAFYLNS